MQQRGYFGESEPAAAEGLTLVTTCSRWASDAATDAYVLVHRPEEETAAHAEFTLFEQALMRHQREHGLADSELLSGHAMSINQDGWKSLHFFNKIHFLVKFHILYVEFI